MPGKIKVKVLAGRNLPVMDRASDTTDAFVEIKFGGVTHKTDVCRKSLNPHWNSTEWYRFEVDESELQDEPLQLRLMDHDTYSANDAIGKVVISLAPLLAREANNTKGTAAPPGGAVMSGWIPVFDTMHGIRGELNVIVKVELFSDFNKYKTSSCGVQFFHCPMIPPGYRATAIHGFVEELVVNDDPEYQWIDKIRTPRASNEARQVAFIKLSNQVQRLVGLKAAELGANAVIGYQQDFDLEGEAGVVARAIGTAVCITPVPTPSQPINIPPCTQQQLKKYLDILATDNDSITDLSQYYQTHQEELQKMLIILNPKAPSLLDETDIIDEDDKTPESTRQSSITSYTGAVSLYQDDYMTQNSLRHLSQDLTDIQKLLNRKDDDDSDSSGPLQKIKKMKTSFFTKRFSKRRTDKQDDQVSIKSNSSDNSRMSLAEIRNEFKKFKRLKKPKFRKVYENKEDEGIGMASVLARSVIHAHTSLACIAETQDSENSPASTMRRTSESEPTINVSDDDVPRRSVTEQSIDVLENENDKQVPEIHFTSLKNINIDCSEPSTGERIRKISESCPTTPVAVRSDNLLKLPGEKGYFGSVSSALSGDSSEIYSSSEDDYESDDMKTDSDKTIETTTSVVQSVLNHEALVAEMERKLNILEASPECNYRHENINKAKSLEVVSSSYKNEETIKRLDVPLVSTSAEKVPDTDLLEKVEETRNQQSNGMLVAVRSSNNGDISRDKMMDYDNNKEAAGLKRTASAMELLSKTHILHSEPAERFSNKQLSSDNSKKGCSSKCAESKGLIHTAMQTILIDKAKALIPEISHPIPMKAELSTDNDKGSPTKSINESQGLIHTAMKTILIDKAQVMLPDASEPIPVNTDSYENSMKNKETASIIIQKPKAIIIDKVNNLLSPLTPDLTPKKAKKFFDNITETLDEKLRKEKPPTGLVNTAMQTILMDKVQSLVDPTIIEADSGKTNVETKWSDENTKLDTTSGLVQTAMETILVDKVQSLMGSKTPLPEITSEPKFEEPLVKPQPETKVIESSGITHTAVETILFDKVQSLLGTKTPEPHLVSQVDDENNEQFKDEKSKSSGLVHTAVETILADKVQSLISISEIDTAKNESNIEKSSSNVQNIITNTRIVIESDDDSEKEKSISDYKIIPKTKILKPSKLKEKKLVRQDSVHSKSESKESLKMSKENISNAPSITKPPVLQHFHPILSGHLETIPSLPESFGDSLELVDETNNASVCDNSHAACGVDRSERDRDKKEVGSDKDKGSPRHARHESYGGREPVGSAQAQNSSLNASSTPMGIHRRSSDSDLSVTPKGGSLNTSVGNTGNGGGAILRPSMNSNNLDMLEYPFLTMSEYPPGFIVHIGGTVCARSVKLVDGGGEAAARAAWWAELRTELRAHARALRCNAVLAYADSAAICEDVCVLSASGTAAVINLDCDFNADVEPTVSVNGSGNTLEEAESEWCACAHVPYSPGAGPYRAELASCGGCRRARVPAVLLATCAKPARLTAYPKAITLTAVAARARRAAAGEPGARDISDQLPFLEYELHKLLLAKLRMQGANALFSLQTQVAIGERCVMALASGTAFKLTALPPPAPPRIKASENDKDAIEIQKAIWDSFTANKAANGYDVAIRGCVSGGVPEVEEEPPTLDLCADKDACVLELDEAEDVETARALATRRPHMAVYTPAMRPRHNAQPLAFVQVSRARLQVCAAGAAGARALRSALTGATYKLRRLSPCALAPPSFQLDLPEDEIQLVVSGTAIPLADPNKPDPVTENGGIGDKNHHTVGSDNDDDIFALDEEQLVKAPPHEAVEEKNLATGQVPACVSLTSQCVAGGPGGAGAAARRVCALRLLFVRETTAVRELGGLSGFLHTFTCEVMAIVRAYTAALGGNALTSFYITQLMLTDNAHKNQGQCLLSVGGDVVHVMY